MGLKWICLKDCDADDMAMLVRDEKYILFYNVYDILMLIFVLVLGMEALIFKQLHIFFVKLVFLWNPSGIKDVQSVLWMLMACCFNTCGPFY